MKICRYTIADLCYAEERSICRDAILCLLKKSNATELCRYLRIEGWRPIITYAIYDSYMYEPKLKTLNCFDCSLAQSTVEPVFGTLTQFMGMRKINTIGIGQANKIMLMVAISYNLKKYLKFTRNKVVNLVKTTEISKSFFIEQ